MKKTYTTVMPDKAGVFLAASEIFSSFDLNITRVSYNHAIDVHMLFVEVEGRPAVLLRQQPCSRKRDICSAPWMRAGSSSSSWNLSTARAV